MNKLMDSFLSCKSGWNKTDATKTREFSLPRTAGPPHLLRLAVALVLGTLLLGFSPQLVGQAVNATLLGTVTDSTGASVANVKVMITETNTVISRTSATNDSGNYVFPDLPPGTYTVLAELAGFKRESRSGIDVIVNTTQRVDLVLQPGS